MPHLGQPGGAASTLSALTERKPTTMTQSRPDKRDDQDDSSAPRPPASDEAVEEAVENVDQRRGAKRGRKDEERVGTEST